MESSERTLKEIDQSVENQSEEKKAPSEFQSMLQKELK
jgi:hypothetical protein